MLSELLQVVNGGPRDTDRRVYGVALAKVLSNNDLSGLGRVQLHLPWVAGTSAVGASGGFRGRIGPGRLFHSATGR